MKLNPSRIIWGIICPRKVLSKYMDNITDEPVLSFRIGAVLEPTGTVDSGLEKRIRSLFNCRVYRLLIDFFSDPNITCILNLTDLDITQQNKTDCPVIKGVAANLIWHLLLGIEKLTIEHEMLLQALDSTIEGVQIADATGKEIFVNKAFLSITGLSPGERLGKNVFDVSPDGGLAQVIINKQPVRNVRNQPKGTDVELLSNAAPIFINDTFYGAVSVMQDISDVVKAANELKRSQKKVAYLNNKLGDLAQAQYTFDDIIGESKSIIYAKKMALEAAKAKVAVLIQGETGTGKELFAQAIHNKSERYDRPFVAINCAAIPEQLIEGELFGYEKGAFTSATKRRIGMFELAHEGTLFLDEVGDMSSLLQSKLLRALQEEKFIRIGGIAPISVDVRIITATNRDLDTLVMENKFRADLYYRINVVKITVPPLRERLEDIGLLSDFLIGRICRRLGKKQKKVSACTIEKLQKYSWPGNVRELENILEQAVLFCHFDIITPEYITLPLMSPTDQNNGGMTEKGRIIYALSRFGSSVKGKKEAAYHLNMSLATLYNKIKEYQLHDFYQY